MLEWAANNGKAIRQRIVCQETTKFKAETLPLNMYPTSAQTTEKIIIDLEHVEEDDHEESEHDEEQECEYDTESESELLPNVDSVQEDEMTSPSCNNS